MFSKTTILTALAASALGLALSACAPNLCQRKDHWFKSRCAGTDVSYTGDDLCEAALQSCDEGHKQALAGYVMCLEAQPVCSLDTVAACGQANPGGVNLMCTPGQ